MDSRQSRKMAICSVKQLRGLSKSEIIKDSLLLDATVKIVTDNVGSGKSITFNTDQVNLFNKYVANGLDQLGGNIYSLFSLIGFISGVLNLAMELQEYELSPVKRRILESKAKRKLKRRLDLDA